MALLGVFDEFFLTGFEEGDGLALLWSSWALWDDGMLNGPCEPVPDVFGSPACRIASGPDFDVLFVGVPGFVGLVWVEISDSLIDWMGCPFLRPFEFEYVDSDGRSALARFVGYCD